MGFYFLKYILKNKKNVKRVSHFKEFVNYRKRYRKSKLYKRYRKSKFYKRYRKSKFYKKTKSLGSFIKFKLKKLDNIRKNLFIEGKSKRKRVKKKKRKVKKNDYKKEMEGIVTKYNRKLYRK